MDIDIDFLYPNITLLELGHLYCQSANNVTSLSLQSIICSHSVFYPLCGRKQDSTDSSLKNYLKKSSLSFWEELSSRRINNEIIVLYLGWCKLVCHICTCQHAEARTRTCMHTHIHISLLTICFLNLPVSYSQCLCVVDGVFLYSLTFSSFPLAANWIRHSNECPVAFPCGMEVEEDKRTLA